jgi:hypothetical protein
MNDEQLNELMVVLEGLFLDDSSRGEEAKNLVHAINSLEETIARSTKEIVSVLKSIDGILEIK